MSEPQWKLQLQEMARDIDGATAEAEKTAAIDLLQLDLPNWRSSPRRGQTKKVVAAVVKARRKKKPATQYKDSKTQEDLREEIMRLRRQLHASKKDNNILRTQIVRSQAKMREKDANINRILQYHIQGGKDPQGFAVALRNEKLLVKMLNTKISSLEATIKEKEDKIESMHRSMKSVHKLRKEADKLKNQNARIQRELKDQHVPHKFERQMHAMTQKYYDLQRQYDIQSIQHLMALKALDAVDAQRKAVKEFRGKLSRLEELTAENVELRNQLKAAKDPMFLAKLAVEESLESTIPSPVEASAM
uniref:Lebercilin domain-containing protein n=1 Tax=Lotharella oceanica TaxID=641309 RepID=A0A7S2XFF7_9EUKA|mmetsp:Transcript_36489/g.67402  ORF Transcript_36489/g.67402 Transcript_36489/m.67402 type:complete len:304 (+) Transcript_36489:56-967(+)